MMKIQHLFVALTLLTLSGTACGSYTSNAPPKPTFTQEEQLGLEVYSRHCAACHLLTPDDVKVGPSLYGLADRASSRVEGQDARTYLLTSVLDPSAYLVEGFEDVMTKGLAKNLASEELDAVIVYLQTLHEEGN
ncbi:MAG: c-type cytochrome [Chloroflexota bacterium]